MASDCLYHTYDIYLHAVLQKIPTTHSPVVMTLCLRSTQCNFITKKVFVYYDSVFSV